MGNSSTPAKTSLSRVWLLEGRARYDRAPSYESCMRATGVSQGFGDMEKIECPDPYNYDKFIEVGAIRGAEERVTTSLEGRYPLELISKLLRLARKGCAVDIQVHFGQCKNPNVFSAYKKVMIFEDAHFTSYSTEDLGSLASGDTAAINETGEINAARVYEVVPLSFAERATSIVTNEVLDVVICDSVSCGECTDESDGCQKIFAISTAAGGSPGTSADIVFSLDKGSTWYAHDIDSLATAEAPDELTCFGDYLVVVSEDSCSLHYALQSEHDGVTDPIWTEVATGFVATGCPRAIITADTLAFIVGNSGYIYAMEDPTAGVSVQDAGVATANHLLDVDALSDTFAVAVGNNSTIVVTQNGSTWALMTTPPTGVGVNYNCIELKSEKEWWIGTSAGRMYVTRDSGATWTQVAFAGNGAGQVRDIKFVTDSVGYMAHDTATPRARVFRTIDAGHSWVITPEDSTLPLADRVNALAVCSFDPNFVVAVGLGDNGSDGFIAIGVGAEA